MQPRITARAAYLTVPLVFGACVAPGDSLGAGSILRSIDNDSTSGSDDQYTSGVSLSYIAEHGPSFDESPLPAGIGNSGPGKPRPLLGAHEIA